MDKNFKKAIKVDIETLFYDAEYYSLSDWSFCQALKTLIEKWERRIDAKIDSEYLEFMNM